MVELIKKSWTKVEVALMVARRKIKVLSMASTRPTWLKVQRGPYIYKSHFFSKNHGNYMCHIAATFSRLGEQKYLSQGAAATSVSKCFTHSQKEKITFGAPVLFQNTKKCMVPVPLCLGVPKCGPEDVNPQWN